MIKRYCTNFDSTPEVRSIVFSLLQMVHMLLNTPVSEPTTVQCDESGSALMHVYLFDNGKLAEHVSPMLNYLIMQIKARRRRRRLPTECVRALLTSL